MDTTHLLRGAWIAGAIVAVLALPGCLATKIVTVPAKAAYGAGKLAVKGTAAVVRAAVPDDDEKADPEQDVQDPPPEPEPQPPSD